jgi:hypothetical protein
LIFRMVVENPTWAESERRNARWRAERMNVGWLAILKNEAGAGMGNESVPHFMSEGVAKYATCVTQEPCGGNREHSFQVVGRIGPVGHAKAVEEHLPVGYSVRPGHGRIS